MGGWPGVTLTPVGTRRFIGSRGLKGLVIYFEIAGRARATLGRLRLGASGIKNLQQSVGLVPAPGYTILMAKSLA
jgi:hypothetical protein